MLLSFTYKKKIASLPSHKAFYLNVFFNFKLKKKKKKIGIAST